MFWWTWYFAAISNWGKQYMQALWYALLGWVTLRRRESRDIPESPHLRTWGSVFHISRGTAHKCFSWIPLTPSTRVRVCKESVLCKVTRTVLGVGWEAGPAAMLCTVPSASPNVLFSMGWGEIRPEHSNGISVVCAVLARYVRSLDFGDWAVFISEAFLVFSR